MRYIDGRLGTQVRLADGRVGTVVFNGLCGVGIKWGLHNPPPEEFKDTYGDVALIGVRVETTKPADWEWWADALLRDPWIGCERTGFTAEQCVGDDVTILRYGMEDYADDPTTG